MERSTLFTLSTLLPRRAMLYAACLLLFCVTPSLAQPLSPQGPTAIVGPTGDTIQAIPTPDGGRVFYGPQGQVARQFPTPDGGSVTYDRDGQMWRMIPSPAEQQLQPPDRVP